MKFNIGILVEYISHNAIGVCSYEIFLIIYVRELDHKFMTKYNLMKLTRLNVVENRMAKINEGKWLLSSSY